MLILTLQSTDQQAGRNERVIRQSPIIAAPGLVINDAAELGLTRNRNTPSWPRTRQHQSAAQPMASTVSLVAVVMTTGKLTACVAATKRHRPEPAESRRERPQMARDWVMLSAYAMLINQPLLQRRKRAG